MTRSLSGDYQTELVSSAVSLAFLFECEFDTQTLRLWDGVGDLSWDGKIWYGNGWFHGWSGAGESTDIKAIGLSVVLAGVPSSVVSLALGQTRQNRTARLYLAFLDTAGAVASTPYNLYEGKVDTAEIQDGPDSATITLTVEHEFIELDKADEIRMNHETQKARYPDDRGFEYVADVADWSGYWGVPEKKEKPKRKRRKNKDKNKRRK